ncbi:protein late bloomer [Anastrepha obliqua]|uniref:protein late bloomer n=1 Tax=Anastrepha obliqua TaxID=95512 RepID=UPI0024098930|nr:protein late bloomer [Anastrepha obliqua]
MFHCTRKRLKFTLFAFNAICAVMGIILVWFGAWLYSNITEVDIDNSETLIATVIIVLGNVLLIMAAFGCVATYRESKSMLIGYAVILIILLVIQMFLVSISYTAANGSLSSGLQRGFDELWDKGYTNLNTTLSFYEEWLHCCGKSSANDYFLMDKVPPPSCCRYQDCTNVLNLYVDGCEKKFSDYVGEKTNSFNIISWCLISTEFIGSVFACILVDSIRNYRDRIRFYN